MESKESITAEEKQKYWDELVEKVTTSFNSSYTTTRYGVGYSENEKFTRKEFSDVLKAVDFYKEQANLSNQPNLPFFNVNSILPIEGNYHDSDATVSRNILFTKEIKEWQEEVNKDLIKQVAHNLFRKKFNT